MQIKVYATLDECRNDWQKIEKEEFHYPFQEWWYQELFVRHFSSDANIFILGIFEDERILALGAFEEIDKKVVLLGTKDVSSIPNLVQDITDFADLLYTKEGQDKAAHIWQVIQDFFTNKALSLDLRYIREDSSTYKALLTNTPPITEQEVSPYIPLPESWEGYLAILDKKQRHELKRKMNRLLQVPYKFEKKDITRENFDSFIKLHKLSDFNKAKFMTSSMENFFWDLVLLHKDIWQTSFYTLAIEDNEVSSVLVFENDSQILLYNSGFDPSFGYYSVGLLGKAFILQKAILEKKKIYDFLRGGERYKYDLGAQNLQLYRILLS